RASAFAGRARPAVERGGGGEGGGLRRDCGGRARDEGRPEHDWARSEGLAEPRLLDGRGAAQGRGHSSVDGQGPDAVGGLATIARAGDDGRPDAAVAMGLQEPRQAGDGASRPGSQSEFLDKLLEELKYCRHSNRKTKEAGKHPDRDAQFEYINAKVEAFQAAGEPVISID